VPQVDPDNITDA
jgi:hypothetical protein